MKTLSVTEVARNFSAVLDAVERDQEEIVPVRNERSIARLLTSNARDFADIPGLQMVVLRHVHAIPAP